MPDGPYVYLYRTQAGQPRYVGYGMTPARAMSHPGHSHNDEFRAWLSRGDYRLEISGPYRDEREGKAVESALISALKPSFNIALGDGPRFVPLGVPPELADRPSMSALDLPEIGRVTGGALLVYLAAGDFLRDGRRKFDPALPRDEDVLSNIEGVWEIGRHLDEWKADPSKSPQVLVGVHGKSVKHRFIVGAVAIDTASWGRADLEVPERQRWRVPVVRPIDLDRGALRGRRVEGVRFGQFSSRLHIWVDGDGVQRHPG